MMKQAKKFLILGTMALMTFSAAACGKKPEPVGPAPVADDADRREAEERARREAEERARREADARAAEEAAREAERKRSVLTEMVFFDYDDASIRADARAALDAKVRIMRDEAAIRVRVAGHADERGSTEYNMVLGMRRAQSIKDYLAGYGVSADRLEIQSLGEERPLATGHDESAWSRNRRGEFTILAGLRAGN
jgi:peptidoglycan-associated lipoprotein